MKKVRHVLGISGGKDSAALAIYMRDHYPDLDIEYYTADTGKELDATYKLIENLEVYLGKKIIRLAAYNNSHLSPFDHKLKTLGGYLPSPQRRWCTKSLKLDMFEQFVGNDPVISYVGIRGDEDREGYISTKTNIQSIFPFRKNIWSEDVLIKFFNYDPALLPVASDNEKFLRILNSPISDRFIQSQKLNQLLNIDIIAFNQLVFSFLQTTAYPLAQSSHFPLLDNKDNLKIEDIFELLNHSGVGVPEYYNKIEFEVNGKKGTYCRSRSGCYFCFFQQKIEWVWLYEQHPDLFFKAMEYEKDDEHTWNQKEKLAELMRPERIIQIKEEYLARQERKNISSSDYLVDIITDAEEDAGCAACFI
ncbi:phosphoadenosine phosphosulfate reductase family protein [Mucilaginibacter sp. SP1R1]|uniref:phosphoadenosine phosphosulfate reductase family protein n=1 Tax=Mucilaginibacter sp. SP1R1 TaxID=2723091 RepID=UPI0016214F3B|nr:phosphoadenosine phosphosulfate reductase family protein [Mucilaginibacter sp. SP1R1]MBB6150012.1 3'-phosphoadenosine 5'-phosphosulfate sulfotransferase (PAPS reductase)/FAD synthetase [Mucilaginibacter sp. SP1R1]